MCACRLFCPCRVFSRHDRSGRCSFSSLFKVLRCPGRAGCLLHTPYHCYNTTLAFDIAFFMPRINKMGDFNHSPPMPYKDDIRAYKKEYAQALDAQDPLRHLRNEFIIPSKQDLKRKTLASADECMSKSRLYL